MIVWTRWGILSLFAALVGVGIGAAIGAVFGTHNGPGVGVFVGIGLLIGAALSFVLARCVITPHLDKPQPMFVLQPLPAPIVNERGVRQTHRQVPVLDPQTGRQLYRHPRSTLFFIPVSIWPFVVAGIGILVTVVSEIRLAMG